MISQILGFIFNERKVLLIVLVVAGLSINAQELQWARSNGGSNSFTVSHSITSDKFGNLYTVGQFQDTIDFDPGPNELKRISKGETDFFIQKLDSNGGLVWVQTFGDSSHDVATFVKTDGDNLIVGGHFKGKIDCDFSPDTTYLSNKSDNPLMFILKLNLNGDLIWAIQNEEVAKYSYSSPTNFELNNIGEIFIGGNFGDSVDFDPSINTEIREGKGIMQDVFVCKLDSNGKFRWVKTFGSMGYDRCSLSLDKKNSIYVSGQFTDTFCFELDTGIFELYAAGGGIFAPDIFVLKLDSSGKFIWAKRFGDFGIDQSSSINVGNSNAIYIAGNFQGKVDFDPDTTNYFARASWTDIFLLKLDSSGNFFWVKTFGGSGIDLVHSIEIDNQEMIYLTGEFEDTVNFNVNSFSIPSISKVHNDGYVLKLNRNGVSEWVGTFECNWGVGMYQVSVDDSENIYLCGYYGDSIDVDPDFTNNFLVALGRSGDGMSIKLGRKKYSYIFEKNETVNASIFPNPSNGVLDIRAMTSISSISVINLSGEVLLTQKAYGNSTKVDLTQLSNGTYVLKIALTSGDFITRKVIVSN